MSNGGVADSLSRPTPSLLFSAVSAACYSDYKKVDGVPMAQKKQPGSVDAEATDF